MNEHQHFKRLKDSRRRMLREQHIGTEPHIQQNGGSAAKVLHDLLHIPRPDEPFPYLEKLVVAVKKYPYTAIGVMISIAAVIISAVTVLAVSIIGGMFLMYGEMKENTALMQEIKANQKAIEERQLDDGKVMRAYEAANGKRIEFVVGMLNKEAQEKVNQYDRAHPSPLMPEERK